MSGIPSGVLVRRGASSVALWAVVLALVLSGWQIGCWLVITFFGMLGQWEFYLSQRAKGLRVYKKWGLFCGFLLFCNSLWFLILRPEHQAFSWVGVSLLIVLNIIGVLVRMVLSRAQLQTPIVTVALSVFGVIYVPYLFNYVCRVAFWPGHSESTKYVLIYLLAVSKFADVGAFLVGSLVGKHKMCPHISPGKTWEGFVGGVLSSLAMSILLIWLAPGQVAGIGFKDAVILGLLLSVASTVGDLAESVVKRDAAIKDSGSTIPGIGGILDLIDSILFTAPVLYFYLYFVTLGRF
jgi:phosphatidate cytidylyltransferase